MSTDTEILINTEELGNDVVAFLQTSVGKHLIDQQRLDEKEACEALLAFDPFEYKTYAELLSAIVKAQEAVTLARKVNGYLHDAILNGKQAESILDNSED